MDGYDGGMILSLLLLLSLEPAQPPHRFVYLGADRFAHYADLASLEPEGAGGRIRVFQVVEADFRAGDAPYWGGWSWWRFDCGAEGQIDRLDFAAVREGGVEGPLTADDAPPRAAVQGETGFELVVAACNPGDYDTDATTLEEAVAEGRANLAVGR